MSHEEYVEKKRFRVYDLAAGMIDGSVDCLEGAIELSSLCFQVDVPEDDQDYIAFVAIASEIDHLPIGAARQHWSADSLARHEPGENWGSDTNGTKLRGLRLC